MDQYLQFAMAHWPLILAFILLLILIIITELKQQSGGAERVSPQEATRLINHGHATVIDVQEVDAYKNGHIVNAKNFPLKDIETQLAQLGKYKSKPIILACKNGQNSAKAAAALLKDKFEKVHCLKGGLQAWTSANLPLAKGHK